MPFILPLVVFLFCCAHDAQAEIQAFGRFSADLSQEWAGEEREGFRSGNPEEYMLILAHQNPATQATDALVSLFIIPNEDGGSSEEVARKLAQFQADATAPRQDGVFWAFTGEPRSPSFRAPAVTRVRATPQRVLIAIVQSQDTTEAEAVFAGLRGLTPEARELLGR